MTYLLGFVAKVDPIIGTVSAAILLFSWLTATRTRALVRILKGKSEQRYVRWFLDQYSTYQNPYLDASEPLQLDRTYIPLSFVDSDRDGSERDLADLPAATATIADPSAGNIIIVGDAGSGKTTTLKAYGVATLQGRGRGAIVTAVDHDRREVPFFVPMRALAASLHRGIGLAKYLETDLLGAGARLSRDEARELLTRLVEQHRCIVLLDGLDEVTRDDYALVRDEVNRFARDQRPEQPTANARLIISCRHHNFLRIRDDWLVSPDPFVKRVYALAPLREAEIVSYLHKLRDRFRRSDGPEHFMAAMRTSKTLHLHRVPLVLAMSVGLFARRAAFEIPSSIAELYDIMIKEMLDRHRTGDGLAATVEFLRDDKLRVLREFSLITARKVGFETFTRESLAAFTRELRPKLLDLREGRVDAFVDEIIDRSGLLSPVSDNEYEFAHRSIQEHLVAAELLRKDGAAESEQASLGGRRELRSRSVSRDWRQVVLFYTAAADQGVVSPLLAELATGNGVEAVVLAGSCLAGANCLDDVGFRVLDKLAVILRAGEGDMLLPALDAMLGATTSPRLAIRTRAADLFRGCLTHVINDADAAATLGGNIDGVVGVITTLVDLAGPIGIDPVLVSQLAAVVPDDPRLVQPLWRSLMDPSSSQYDAGNEIGQGLGRITKRLLTLATDPACFQELQRQPAEAPAFVTADLRERVYPFRYGLDPSSNLVTLLCWADQLGVTLPEPNRFLEAMAADRAAWARIEADRNRRAYTIRLPGFPLLRKLPWHPLVKFVGLGLTILTLTVTVATITDMYRDDAALDLLGHLVILVVAMAELGLSLVMLGVGMHIGPSHLLQLWQANPYVDVVYNDPKSRHWLVRAP